MKTRPDPRPGGDPQHKRPKIKRLNLSSRDRRNLEKAGRVEDSLDKQFKSKGFRPQVDYDQNNIKKR